MESELAFVSAWPNRAHYPSGPVCFESRADEPFDKDRLACRGIQFEHACLARITVLCTNDYSSVSLSPRQGGNRLVDHKLFFFFFFVILSYTRNDGIMTNDELAADTIWTPISWYLRLWDDFTHSRRAVRRPKTRWVELSNKLKK
jgi:hypothetical protein